MVFIDLSARMATFPNRHCLEIGRNFLVQVAPHPDFFVPDIGYHHISAQEASPMQNSGPNCSFQTGLFFSGFFFVLDIMNYQPPASPDPHGWPHADGGPYRRHVQGTVQAQHKGTAPNVSGGCWLKAGVQTCRRRTVCSSSAAQRNDTKHSGCTLTPRRYPDMQTADRNGSMFKLSTKQRHQTFLATIYNVMLA